MAESLRTFCQMLGFRFVLYPDVARSSSHLRGGIQTAPLTGTELKEVEDSLGVLFTELHDEDRLTDAASLSRQNKALMRILEAQSAKQEPEDDQQKEADLKKTKAERTKLLAEAASLAMDAFHKFGKGLLSVALACSIIVGTVAMERTKSEHPSEPAKTHAPPMLLVVQQWRSGKSKPFCRT
jgi:hypothetical protein